MVVTLQTNSRSVMEVISRLIKVQLPNYLRSLPIPASLGGFAQLSGGEWIQLVPFVVTTSVVIYVVVSSTRDPKASFVNKDIQKDKDKVANVIDVEDLGEKTAYCRCWKSKKFPLCDGTHNTHNKETGDNVGPLVIKKKAE